MQAKLQELAKLQLGYQTRGSVPEGEDGSHRLLQMRDIGEGAVLNWNDVRRITPDREVEPYLLDETDVLFQVRGMDHHAYVVPGVPHDTVASSHFYVLRPDTTRILPEYLAWYLNQPTAQAHLLRGIQGSGTISLVRKPVLDSLEIPVPELEVQSRIAAILRLREEERTLETRLDGLRDRLLNALVRSQ